MAQKQISLDKRKTAYRVWALSQQTAFNKKQPFQAAASKTNLPLKVIEKLYIKDKWEERYDKDIKKGTFKKEIEKEKDKALEHLTEDETVDRINMLLDDSGIPDRWKLFIMYYLQSFNATAAARKAGYTNHSSNIAGSQIINNPKVKEVLSQCKELMQIDIYTTGKDILNEYVKIAFADMTDYVEFDGKSVKLRDSSQVDGRLITEVKQGRDGVTIKLADKMKAMDKLEKLFDVIPDRRLELDIKKYELTKDLASKEIKDGNGNRVVIINDL